MYRIVRSAYEDKQNERGHICSYYLINYIDWIQINVLYKFTRIRFVYRQDDCDFHVGSVTFFV